MLNLAEFKLIIFDLDGTITLSIHDFEQIKRDLNLPLNQDILTSLHDLNSEDRLIAETKLQEIESDLAKQSKLQTGIITLLKHLHTKKIHLAILTRNTKANAITSLQVCGIQDYFNPFAILGRDETAAKPDSAGIMRLIDYFKVNKSETVMIGDYKYDLIAGRNAGVTTVYFDPDLENLWNDYADFKIETYL